MPAALTIIGSFVSPYVRKVLACLNLKGLDYEVDPITPFYGNDEFERLSPLRRIPVLIDGDFSVSDSSVICAYLDEAYGGHPLFPPGPKDRARARWQLPLDDFLFGEIGAADIAIATFFRNGAYAGFETDAGRWPRTAGFIERTLAHPAIASLLPFEDVQRGVAVAGRRQALLDAGARLTSETMGLREPRKGKMRL
jgi:glutathione S-transferase